MVNQIGNAPEIQPQPVDEILRQTALRRQINAELAEIKEFIIQHVSQDAMTQEIIQWHEMFTNAMRLQADAKFVLDQFIALLQDILRDPFSQAPLDEETYLGSDGFTYAHKSLCLYLRSVSQELRSRSPLNPIDPTEFTVQPHHTVRHVIQWLQSHNALLHSEEHERLYRQLIEQLPIQQPLQEPVQPPNRPIREDRDERLRRIRQRQREIEQERNQELERYANQVRAEIAQEVNQAFQPIQERVQQFAQEQLNRIEEVRAYDQERVEALQPLLRLPQNDQQDATFRARLTEIERIIAHGLDTQIRILGEEIRELRNANVQIRNQTDAILRTCKIVQAKIQETKKALKEQKKKRLTHVFTTLASIGASCLATWALQGTIASMGSGFTAAVTPTKGGAQVTWMTKF